MGIEIDDGGEVARTDALTTSIKAILTTTDAKPSRVSATYEWEESDNGEEVLVPSIDIRWFNLKGEDGSVKEEKWSFSRAVLEAAGENPFIAMLLVLGLLSGITEIVGIIFLHHPVSFNF